MRYWRISSYHRLAAHGSSCPTWQHEAPALPKTAGKLGYGVGIAEHDGDVAQYFLMGYETAEWTLASGRKQGKFGN